jgi:hypothetical protein
MLWRSVSSGGWIYHLLIRGPTGVGDCGNSYTAIAVLPREMEDERSAAARRLASLRRVYTKTCPVCGTEFAGIARRVYDRHACQVKAYRSRRKQRETAVN